MIIAEGTHVAGHVAATFFDFQLNLDATARRQVRNQVVRIDDLDIVRQLDVRGVDQAFAFLFQGQRHLVAVVQLEHDPL